MDQLNALIVKALNSSDRGIMGKYLNIKEEPQEEDLSISDFEQLEKFGIAEKYEYPIYSINTGTDYSITVHELKYSKSEFELFGIDVETEDFSKGLNIVLEKHKSEIDELIKKITVDEVTKAKIQQEISKNNFRQYDAIFSLKKDGFLTDVMELCILIENIGYLILRNNGIIMPIEKYKEFLKRTRDVRIENIRFDSIGLYSWNDPKINSDSNPKDYRKELVLKYIK